VVVVVVVVVVVCSSGGSSWWWGCLLSGVLSATARLLSHDLQTAERHYFEQSSILSAFVEAMYVQYMYSTHVFYSMYVHLTYMRDYIAYR
jgi:hypothetical protein